MSFDLTVWGPSLAVLAVGGAVAALAISTQGRSAADKQKAQEEGRKLDLLAQRERAVEALKTLELDRDKLSEEAYQQQRESLIRSGAEALRALDAQSPKVELSDAFQASLREEQTRLGDRFRPLLLEHLKASEVQNTPVSPAWIGAAWATAVAAAIGLLVWYAAGDATDRTEGAPMTGGTSIPRDETAGEEQQALLAKIKENPKDLESINRLTILALAQQDPSAAMQWNEMALGVDPKDPDARTQRAAIRAMLGMTDDALMLLDEVLVNHPDHGITLFYKGMIAMRAGKPEIAVPALERAMEVQPDPFIQKQLDRARMALKGGAPSETPSDVPSEASLIAEGEVTLAEGAQIGAGTVLFVNVRTPGGGPPLAAVKLPPGPFPMKFRITTADRLPMGGDRPLPAEVQLGIRLDADGNAFTKEGLPAATVDGVAPGATGLQVSLQ